ncbi:glycosyltransferase family 25 protein [Pelagibacterium xiamenense]|uniref:glycosyltransferase family 25 protein n=1 Tax=Pelagibacterium xiamenense TaxID=2901140 RepID=UPI001E555696|nr:glycosyltransferase family 25 protein [Pelagibacterium xiamenense]MCD7059464.1 glycosyltransferase family 25 protein [Pelagibacterium xiamenense]
MPIYYINLSERTDRRAFMEEQFARLGLAAERIEAVTPADIPEADIARYCDNTRPSYLRPNQLACTLSHEKAWRTMLEAGHARAVVMEDDAVLSALLPAFLDDLDGVAFDVVRFEAAVRKVRVLPPVAQAGPRIALRPFRSTLPGASGYVIGEDAARSLLGHPMLRLLANDLVLYGALAGPAKDFMRLHTDPALCIQVGDISQDNRGGGVGRSDLNAVKMTHVYAQKHPLRHFLRRTRRGLADGARNAIDHLAHIPRGITKKDIPYRGE